MAKVPGDYLLGRDTINKVLKLSSIFQTICFMLLVFYTIYTFYIVFFKSESRSEDCCV